MRSSNLNSSAIFFELVIVDSLVAIEGGYHDSNLFLGGNCTYLSKLLKTSFHIAKFIPLRIYRIVVSIPFSERVDIEPTILLLTVTSALTGDKEHHSLTISTDRLFTHNHFFESWESEDIAYTHSIGFKIHTFSFQTLEIFASNQRTGTILFSKQRSCIFCSNFCNIFHVFLGFGFQIWSVLGGVLVLKKKNKLGIIPAIFYKAKWSLFFKLHFVANQCSQFLHIWMQVSRCIFIKWWTMQFAYFRNLNNMP